MGKKSPLKRLLCLGIETTAHTFGASVVASDGSILSNEKDAFQTTSGGMIPFEVAQHHVEVCDVVIKNALAKAGVSVNDLACIAVSSSPGIGPMLRIGCTAARSLAGLYKKPLVPVNHCIAHLEIGRLVTPAKDPVLLYASGANTQVIAFEGGKYRVFGETLDIGIGNLLDTFARHAKLGFPGGPKIEKLAACCKNKEKLIELPYCVKGMDVTFGGILTNLKQKFDSSDYALENISYTLQETVFAMLVEVSERALAHTGKTELVLGGGVACNKRLQEMCRIMCEERGAHCFVPENALLVDNAAMIAWTGILAFQAGIKIEWQHAAQLKKDPYLRTDEVEIPWRTTQTPSDNS